MTTKGTRESGRITRLCIVCYMWEHYSKHDYYPTLREIAEAAGLSTTSVVSYHLRGLAERGWVRLGPKNSPRTTVLTQAAKDFAVKLPSLKRLTDDQARGM